ncbi:N-acetyltransferase domain-containing protein OS=Ureibacillus acetophenoni OX=614649 GN=SAMN05877842_106195 PE=4 SV=1 [Ureibacillus acetophenoni]
MTTVVNINLARTLEQAEIDMLTSRLTAIQNIKENPMGIEIQTFGHATAFSAKNIPGPSFNTVKGLRAGDEPYVEAIIDYFHQKNIPILFELTPANTSKELLTYLNKLGFYQIDFHTTLYKHLSMEDCLNPQLDSDITIRKLNENEFDLFGEIYTKGFQMPDFLAGGVAANNKILYSNPQWTFYLAMIGERPVGIGVLFEKDQVATLSAATTLPEERNKGIQSALIQQRMIEAIHNENNLIVGQAKFGSVSQNNMERATMKIAYTKAIWIKGN